MAGPFFKRLRDYYLDVAAVLRGEAKIASIFPNASDIGGAREKIYAEFLRQHSPSKCNVFLGGFIFGEDGSESSQMDVIVTTDTTPRFDFHNKDGQGKAFSPVEGTLGVASIKSTLDKEKLEDALKGIASVPLTGSLEKRVSFGITIKNYDDWPYKIIYASDGITAETLVGHIKAFYDKHPEIPLGRRPNLIHVAGKYLIIRSVDGMSTWDVKTKKLEKHTNGEFILYTRDSDLQAIIWALNGLQERASASTHILYHYGDLINRVNDVPPETKIAQ